MMPPVPEPAWAGAAGESTVTPSARSWVASSNAPGGPVPPAPFDGFEVLVPARDYKNRHASILLAMEAAAEAVAQAEAGAKAAQG